MKRKQRYRIIIEDESKLQTLLSHRVNKAWLYILPILAIIVMLIMGTALMMLTPLHQILPGYLKESQRVRSQQDAIRIDSLSQVMNANQVWIDNLLRLNDIGRMDGDSINYVGAIGGYNPDSLPDAGLLEQRFVSALEERERFNISVLAPLDADGMMFSPVSTNAIFASQTRNTMNPEILLPTDSPIQAITDGVVLATYYAPGSAGHCIILQHSRGFCSAYYHTGVPLVSEGDVVNSGQSIAFAPKPDSRNTRRISLRIWHNGTATPPAELLNN